MSSDVSAGDAPRLTVPVGPGDHVRGSASAAIELLEYGDFECPHCGRAYEIVRQLERRFASDVRFVFRHFPLTNVHPHAQRASETAEWAAKHGAFWAMHDRLFEHQRHLSDESLVGHARAIGLDPSELPAVWVRHTFLRKVKDDFASGLASGVPGTPGFFLDGVRHNGPWELAELSAAIEARLGSR